MPELRAHLTVTTQTGGRQLCPYLLQGALAAVVQATIEWNSSACHWLGKRCQVTGTRLVRPAGWRRSQAWQESVGQLPFSLGGPSGSGPFSSLCDSYFLPRNPSHPFRLG